MKLRIKIFFLFIVFSLNLFQCSEVKNKLKLTTSNETNTLIKNDDIIEENKKENNKDLPRINSLAREEIKNPKKEIDKNSKSSDIKPKIKDNDNKIKLPSQRKNEKGNNSNPVMYTQENNILCIDLSNLETEQVKLIKK